MSLMSMKVLTNMTHMQYRLSYRPCWSYPESLVSQNEIHDDIWLICNTIWDNAMLQASFKFGEPKRNHYWGIMLMKSTGINYVPNEYEDVDQYGSIAIPSEIMPHQSYPESLEKQTEIPTELSCWRVHLALIMSLRCPRRILTNMTHMPYHPR